MATTNFQPVFKVLKIILIFSTLCQGQMNSTEYESMPALYKFDNYQNCVNRDDPDPDPLAYPAKYCMVYVEIQPDPNSLTWQQIELISANRFKYRHDHIFRGVCMERCKDFLVNNENEINIDKGFLTNEQTVIFQQFHNNSLDHTMRYQYHNEIHECINQEYLENYNLSTKTFVKYCIDPKQSREKDIYFYLTILVIITLILLNIISSIYDAILKAQQVKPDDKYYEVKHNDKVSRYLTSFSIYRNYKRLVVANKSDIGMDLSFLDGFRAILSLLITYEHSFLLQYVQIENPDFIETALTQLEIKLLMHAFIWLELFFVLSGLLMCVKFEKSQYITAKSSFMDCVNVFVRLLVSRYLRYLPSLVFIIIFTANISYYHEHGPFTRFVMDPNCLACRDTWWENILMINNYDMNSSCLMHTWYIAADFHLYGLFLIIIIIMAKYPNFKIKILAGVAILAAGINFGVNYILKLDSIFMLLPESYRYFYMQKIDTAKYLYFSSYTNINSFLVGIVCGLIYMKYLRKNPENKKYLGEILTNAPYIGWTCIAAILYLGTTISTNTETTIWTAAYGLLHRHVGISIVAIIVILRGICNGGGIFKSTPFRILARISYQVYLWQIIVLFHLISSFNEPIHVDTISISIVGSFLYICTNIIAFVVAVSMEYPIAEIINIVDIEKKINPIKTS